MRFVAGVVLVVVGCSSASPSPYVTMEDAGVSTDAGTDGKDASADGWTTEDAAPPTIDANTTCVVSAENYAISQSCAPLGLGEACASPRWAYECVGDSGGARPSITGCITGGASKSAYGVSWWPVYCPTPACTRLTFEDSFCGSSFPPHAWACPQERWDAGIARPDPKCVEQGGSWGTANGYGPLWCCP